MQVDDFESLLEGVLTFSFPDFTLWVSIDIWEHIDIRRR